MNEDFDVATLNPGDVVEVTLDNHQTIVRGPLVALGCSGNLGLWVGASRIWVRDNGEPGVLLESVKLIKKATPEWAAGDVAMIKLGSATFIRKFRGEDWRSLLTGSRYSTETIAEDGGKVTILARFVDGAE